jgi:hypothetical protein
MKVFSISDMNGGIGLLNIVCKFTTLMPIRAVEGWRTTPFK